MNKKDYRIVFMGTPDIAKDVLEALINNGYKTYLSSSHWHSERKGDIGSCRAY